MHRGAAVPPRVPVVGCDVRSRRSPVGASEGMDPSPDPNDDASLVRALVARDEAALSRAYDRHGALVFGIASRVLGRGPDAEEVLQGVFLTLWRTASRFDPSRGSLVGYLVTLARHRAVDRLRARRGRPAAAGGDADLTFLPAAGPGPAEGFGAADAQARAVAALGALSADERRVLEMAYFDGLSQTEIAHRTGDPLGTVKGRTRAALRRLREALPASLGGGR